MKKFFLLSFLLLVTKHQFAQQLLSDFESTDWINLEFSTGKIDTQAINPGANSSNPSTYCMQYVRDTSTYDVIKWVTDFKCIDITPFLSNNFSAPQLSINCRTAAAVGTYIILQLGIKSNDQYPSGVHSEFFAITTVQNQWETLKFHYLQTSNNTSIATTDIDKITMLFAPNSNTTDTFYIDDIFGPPLPNTLANNPTTQKSPNKLTLYPCLPNPAKEFTTLHYYTSASEEIFFELMDLAGNTLIQTKETSAVGFQSFNLDLRKNEGGLYFVRLKTENNSISRKLIIDK